MRTDGVQIDGSAITQARKVIGEDYGNAYVPEAPRQYVQQGQEIHGGPHEAIRPTDLSRRPAEMRRRLDTDQAKLYELIWIRTIASQMKSAELERTTVDIAAKAGSRMLDLRASGQVVKFDGFLALYQEGRDDDADDGPIAPPPRAHRTAAFALSDHSRKLNTPPNLGWIFSASRRACSGLIIPFSTLRASFARAARCSGVRLMS